MPSGCEPPAVAAEAAVVSVERLTMAFGERVLQQDISFRVRAGSVFVVMGGSGSGKSTLLRHLVGLQTPAAGAVYYRQESFFAAPPERQDAIRASFGVMYQQGALWSSMTLGENVALPLLERGHLPPRDVAALVALKLALVGLGDFADYYPAEISGGMRKRAAIARAMALDPAILFLDEPSAGLDPLTSRRLDDLLLELRASLGTPFVVVTHELDRVLAIVPLQSRFRARAAARWPVRAVTTWLVGEGAGSPRPVAGAAPPHPPGARARACARPPRPGVPATVPCRASRRSYPRASSGGRRSPPP